MRKTCQSNLFLMTMMGICLSMISLTGCNSSSTPENEGSVSFSLERVDSFTAAAVEKDFAKPSKWISFFKTFLLPKSATAALDCNGITTVEAFVYDAGGELVASGGPWDCTRRQGTLAHIPAGSNYRVVATAKDSFGEDLYQGQVTGVAVQEGNTTDAGTITMTLIEPDFIVNFPDSNLEKAIRDQIGKSAGEIYVSDLKGITYVMFHARNIQNLEGLQHAKNLISLYLMDNKITDVGAKFIAEHLTLLTHLGVSRNEITDTGVQYITESLSQLKSLALWDDHITDRGVQNIAEHLPKLKDISLTSDQITSAGIECIAENLTDLTSLSLYGPHTANRDVQAIVENLPLLTDLGLYNNQITDVGVQYIAENLTHLTNLGLGSDQITDIGVQYIVGNLKQLTYFNLASEKITDTTAQYIANNLIQLTYLGLFNSSITDISPFLQLSKLKQLNVEYCPLDTHSCNVIVPELENNGVEVNSDCSSSDSCATGEVDLRGTWNVVGGYTHCPTTALSQMTYSYDNGRYSQIESGQDLDHDCTISSSSEVRETSFMETDICLNSSDIKSLYDSHYGDEHTVVINNSNSITFDVYDPEDGSLEHYEFTR